MDRDIDMLQSDVEESVSDSSTSAETVSNENEESEPSSQNEQLKKLFQESRERNKEAYMELSLSSIPDSEPTDYPHAETEHMAVYRTLFAADLAFATGIYAFSAGDEYAARDWLETASEHYSEAASGMFERPFYADTPDAINGYESERIGTHDPTFNYANVLPVPNSTDAVSGPAGGKINSMSEEDAGGEKRGSDDEFVDRDFATPDHKIDVLKRAMTIAYMLGDKEQGQNYADRIHRVYAAAVRNTPEGETHIWISSEISYGMAGVALHDRAAVDQSANTLTNADLNQSLTRNLDSDSALLTGFSDRNTPVIRTTLELMVRKHIDYINSPSAIHLPEIVCNIDITLATLLAEQEMIPVDNSALAVTALAE